jgi:hypothetical protein
MRTIRSYAICLLAIMAFACKKEDKISSPHKASLSVAEFTEKTGRIITTTYTIETPSSVKDLVIAKTINTFIDSLWENKGRLTVTLTPSGNNIYTYTFEYEILDRDADKLVGFHFIFTDENGLSITKDLTLNAILSAEQTLYTRKWKLLSKMWTSADPPVEDLQDCESDDVWVFNADGTWNIEYGAKGCLFDGFNEFPSWYITEDEKTLYVTYRSIFTLEDDVQKYTIKTLNRERLVFESIVDLTDFGLGSEEVFVYTFEAVN